MDADDGSVHGVRSVVRRLGPLANVGDRRRLIDVVSEVPQDPGVFEDLVGYIERSEIRPLLAQTFRLADLVAAQEAFMDKQHVGNIVVLP